MRQSFNERRNFIMIKKPMVQFVKEKYPLLFTFSEVRIYLLFYLCYNRVRSKNKKGQGCSFVKNKKTAHLFIKIQAMFTWCIIVLTVVEKAISVRESQNISLWFKIKFHITKSNNKKINFRDIKNEKRKVPLKFLMRCKDNMISW